MSVERAAYGMFTIVNANMVTASAASPWNAATTRATSCWWAPGATAAHITALADAMGIDTIVLPKLASGLCAFARSSVT